MHLVAAGAIAVVGALGYGIHVADGQVAGTATYNNTTEQIGVGVGYCSNDGWGAGLVVDAGWEKIGTEVIVDQSRGNTADSYENATHLAPGVTLFTGDGACDNPGQRIYPGDG